MSPQVMVEVLGGMLGASVYLGWRYWRSRR